MESIIEAIKQHNYLKEKSSEDMTAAKTFGCLCTIGTLLTIASVAILEEIPNLW
ncbi:hypothetical protein ACFL0U_04070 [Pseudomonadota bacterium]